MKKIFVLFIMSLFAMPVFAKNISGSWHNDLKTLFLKNNAIIYTINIRTFGAKDTNRNDIIDKNEESGNFINAIGELDNLSKMGINTIHILPITPVGKVNAIGTAGSLYAITDFSEINPQLISKKSSLSPENQAKLFITECHKRNIRVIVDLPSCGAFDLYQAHPEYFVKNKEGKPVTPMDWTDVRLFDSGSQTENNKNLIKLYKDFIDMAFLLGADGIRSDVAALKTPKFWSEIINYAKAKDDEFLFLAEASSSWSKPVAPNAICTSSEDLLKSGFDGYLGSYFNLKDMNNGKELIDLVQSDRKLFKKFKNQKSVIGSFSTHDEVSPVLIKGASYSKMIIWLNSTLPLNSYYIDGFPTGDTYNYFWENKYAKNSLTDDKYYHHHKGKLDIFNFSRKPGGDDYTIYEEFVLANKFKNYYADELANAKFSPLKTSNPKVFSYARTMNNSVIVVIGNLDFKNEQTVTVKVPKFNPKYKIINIRVHRTLVNEYLSRRIKTTLNPGDIQVLLIKNLVF